jgi:hypothetical protein
LPPGGPEQLFAALVFLVMAAFVASGTATSARWRYWLRVTAVLGFAAAIAVALAGIAAWLWDGVR